MTGVLDNPSLVDEALQMGYYKMEILFLVQRHLAKRPFRNNASLRTSRKTTQDGFKDWAECIAMMTSLAASDTAVLHRHTNNASIEDDHPVNHPVLVRVDDGAVHPTLDPLLLGSPAGTPGQQPSLEDDGGSPDWEEDTFNGKKWDDMNVQERLLVIDGWLWKRKPMTRPNDPTPHESSLGHTHSEEAEVALPVLEPVALPVLDPVVPPVLEPVALPVLDPVVPPVLEPVALPVLDPVVPPVLEPVAPPVPNPTSNQRYWPFSRRTQKKRVHCDGVLVSVFHPKKKHPLSWIKCMIVTLCVALVLIGARLLQPSATSSSATSSSSTLSPTIELPALDNKPLSWAPVAAPQPSNAIVVGMQQPMDARTLGEEELTKPADVTVMQATFEYFELDTMGLVSAGIICELESSPDESSGGDGILAASPSNVSLERHVDVYTGQELITVGFDESRFSNTPVCEAPANTPHSGALEVQPMSDHETLSAAAKSQVPSVPTITSKSTALAAYDMIPTQGAAWEPRRAIVKVSSLDMLQVVYGQVHHVDQDDSQDLVIWQPRMSPKLVIDENADQGRIATTEPSKLEQKALQGDPSMRDSTLDHLFIRAACPKHDRSKALTVWQPRGVAVPSGPTSGIWVLEVWFDYWEKESGDVLVNVDCSAKFVNLPALMNGTVVLQDLREPLPFLSRTIGIKDVTLMRFQGMSSELAKVDFGNGLSNVTVVCSEPSSTAFSVQSLAPNRSKSSEGYCIAQTVLPFESNATQSHRNSTPGNASSMPRQDLLYDMHWALTFETYKEELFFLFSLFIRLLWLLFKYCFNWCRYLGEQPPNED